MYLICQVGPSNFLLQIQRNAEGWLDDRHQLHRESLLVEDFLFTLEVGFADYCVQAGGSSGEGSFDRLQGSPSQKLPADSHFSSLFMNQRPKWQNYSNCWTGSTQNVQRVGVLKCAMTSWDLWRILWSVTTWYCGLVYPPTTTWWYILVHLLDIEAQCNTEIHHWDTRMLKICQCDNRVCSNVAIRHMAIW